MSRSKKIKILYTIPNFNTAGSGRSVYDLVKNLDKDIFIAEICCFHDEGNYFKEVEKLGVTIHLFPFTANYRPWFNFPYRVLRISKFFKKHNFDIIHSWHWSSDISEPIAARIAKIPFVYTKKAMGFQNRYWSWRSKLSTKIIAVNKDMVSQYFGGFIDKVSQFPLGVDVDKFSPQIPESGLIEGLNISEEDFVIISVVNMVPVKGIEILVDAVLFLRNPNIKVLIVGNNTNDYAISIMKKYENFKQISFVGKKLDVRPYLSRADLFVIPTKNEGRKEGIPNAPLEAMAMEKIVLGSNISGIKDILEPFHNFLFSPDDIEELRQKISICMQMNLLERAKIEKKMRKFVVENFSTKVFIRNHERLYLEIVNK